MTSRPSSEAALEEGLSSLPGVRRARVESREGAITAVKVLVVPERPVQHIIRDVYRLMIDRLDSAVDPDLIEIISTGDQAPTAGRRRKLSALRTSRRDGAFEVELNLELQGDVLMGSSGGKSGSSSERRTVARATLDGMRKLLDDDVAIDEVEVLSVGDRRLAVVILDRGEGALVGAAVVKADEHDAVSRATLSALNRVVTRA